MECQEIERKWLMEGFPPLPIQAESEMEQGYLSFAPAVRIRKAVRNGVAEWRLTIKGGGTLCRTEVELPLTAVEYAALQGLLAAPSATKCLRLYSLEGGATLECSCVDQGKAEEFYYAEVEFDSEEEAHAFQPPAFFGP